MASQYSKKSMEFVFDEDGIMCVANSTDEETSSDDESMSNDLSSTSRCQLEYDASARFHTRTEDGSDIQGCRLGCGERAGFTSFFTLPDHNATQDEPQELASDEALLGNEGDYDDNDADESEPRALDSDDRELLGLADGYDGSNEGTPDAEKDDRVEETDDHDFEFDEWSGPRFYPMKGGMFRYFARSKVYHMYTRRHGRSAIRRGTPYLPAEISWLADSLRRIPVPRTRDLVLDFNQQFAGKVAEGCNEPRQARTENSLSATITKLGLRKKAVQEVAAVQAAKLE